MLRNRSLKHKSFLNHMVLFLLNEMCGFGSISYHPKLRGTSGWSLVQSMLLYSSTVYKKILFIANFGLMIKMGLSFSKLRDP